MPSWKKILQSGSAVHVLNITASSLPNLSQPNIIGYDTASGRFTYFSTSSLGSGGSIIGGSGTTNYITRWSSSTLITTSSIYESGSRIGIGTGAVLPNAVLHISGASNDNLLTVSSPTATNALFISGSGRIGIGTTTPITTLDVVGSINASGFVASLNSYANVVRGYLTASFGAPGIDFPTTAIVHISGASNDNLLRVSSPTDQNILFVSGSGRVGIGTGTPNATLQIAGTLNNGINSTPSGIYSHAEGAGTLASGIYSHAEGSGTIASGYASHAEGISTLASGSYSHAEGTYTSVLAPYSHAEGYGARVELIDGEGAAHAEGLATIASGSFQHVQGQWNRATQKQSAFIIGNGHTGNTSARKNLVEINPTEGISDFFGPVRITKTVETSTQNPDTLRDQNKAGIIYMGFTHLFNTESRGPSPPIAVKVNNTATNGSNYGTLRHPYSDGVTSAINPAHAILRIDNAQYSSPSPTLIIGRTSNPFNVINTGIFTDGAVTAQEFRALGSWAISQTSDIRLKKNIENLDINTALRLVQNVKPVTFNWNRPDTNDAFDRINGSFDVGVIAQDVLKNGFDHLVRTAKNEKMPEHIGDDGEISEKGYEFSVSYVGMIPYHAKVIKYLLDEVKELKSEIERLRKNGNT